MRTAFFLFLFFLGLPVWAANEVGLCQAFGARAYKAPSSLEILKDPDPSIDLYDDKVGSQQVATIVAGRARVKDQAGTIEQPFVCLLAPNSRPVSFILIPSENITANGGDPHDQCHAISAMPADIDRCIDKKLDAAQKELARALASAKTRMQALDAGKKPRAVPNLEAGQAAWITYRDNTCSLAALKLSPLPEAASFDKSCRIRLMRSRTAELDAIR